MTQSVHRMLPLYEGRVGHQFNHRAATFTGLGDTDIEPLEVLGPDDVSLPRYWVREEVVEDRLARRTWGTEHALLGFRRVARNTDERTVIAALLPFGAASYGWIMSAGVDATGLSLLCAQYNSFVFDFVARQFLSQPSIPQGTFEQLPVLPPVTFETPCAWGPEQSVADWIRDRVLQLTYTAHDMASLARDLGYDGPPFKWDPDRRTHLRAELDACFFHLYKLTRDEVDYIMETFPIVRRKDESTHGTYRTKDLILNAYEAMTTLAPGER